MNVTKRVSLGLCSLRRGVERECGPTLREFDGETAFVELVLLDLAADEMVHVAGDVALCVARAQS